MSAIRPDRHRQQGISAQAFADSLGISAVKVVKYCKAGRIIGARKHPLTGRWWIYPPAKLHTGRQS
jgi:hypothetical protein